MANPTFGLWGYTVDRGNVKARGVVVDDATLEEVLTSKVRPLLQDEEGKESIRELLSELASTGFMKENIERLLDDSDVSTPDWMVGEALAEAFVCDEHGCSFPWPTGRDLKNPEASPTGADMVGFQKTDDTALPYRFAFGEVKTSSEKNWPPQVAHCRTGLQQQIENLRDSTKVKGGLFRYLGHHAGGKSWSPMYISAATRYLSSEYNDVILIGVLVRDVEPNKLDLKQRAINLSKDKHDLTDVAFYALYLSEDTIQKLPTLSGMMAA